MEGKPKAKIRFPEGNKIIYGQDFTLWVGVPHDVEFEVDKVESSGIWLRAPGYGDNPYGNGRIKVLFWTEDLAKDWEYTE